MAKIQTGYEYTITIKGFVPYDIQDIDSSHAALKKIEKVKAEFAALSVLLGTDEMDCGTKVVRRRDNGETPPEPKTRDMRLAEDDDLAGHRG